MRLCFALGLVASLSFLTLGTSVGHAQPLVTGSLSAYYDFDTVTEDGIWLDGSGNDLHALTVYGQDGVGSDANEDGLEDIRLMTVEENAANVKRGVGSAWFDTDPAVAEDRIAVCDPFGFYPDGCDVAEDKDLIPTRAISVAAWLKLEDTGTDQSVWQTRSDNGGFTHMQVNNGGRFRATLRGDVNSDNIVSWTDQSPPANPIPYEEWFHYAVTYEKGEDPEGKGSFAYYLNGQRILDSENNPDAFGNVAGDPDLDVLGNWGQGAFIGIVPDFARQTVGFMDEFYLFTRKITDEEVLTLYNINGSDPCDLDGDGSLGGGDADELSAAIAAGLTDAKYDINGDTFVNSQDIVDWLHNCAGTWVGDVDFDGLFDSNDLITVAAALTYEADVDAVYTTGDFTGDGRFTPDDLITAAADLGYEAGPFTGVAAVPEPSTLALLTLGGLFMAGRLRRRG